jgi:ABC-type Mn2+/Zn2+ transport system permease subunit
MPEVLAPLGYAFMQRGLVAVALVGVLCAVVGSYVVLRGLAFIGEALRHGMFAGTVVAFMLGASLLLGSLLMALLTAYLIQLLGREARVGEGTAIGVLYTGAFALGVVLLGFTDTGVRDLSRLLMGDVLGIDTSDLLIVAGVTVATLALVVYLYKELQIAAFDPGAASAMGLPLGAINGLLFLMIAGALTSAYLAVGNLLAVALLLVPAATARLLTKRLPSMMLTAAGLAVGAGVSGLWLSFYLNAPSGPLIVLVSVGMFLAGVAVRATNRSRA